MKTKVENGNIWFPFGQGNVPSQAGQYIVMFEEIDQSTGKNRRGEAWWLRSDGGNYFWDIMNDELMKFIPIYYTLMP